MAGTKVPRDPNMSAEVRRFLDDLARSANAPADAGTIQGRAVGATTGPPTALTPNQAWAILETATTLPIPSGKMTFEGTSGDEGGQFQMEIAANSTLSADVVVDQYIDKIRIFENGGSARGFYLTITKGAASAARELTAYEKIAAESVGTGTTYSRALVTGAKRIDIHLYNISHNNGASQNLRIELSDDGGSTWSSAITVTSAAFGAASAVHGMIFVQSDGTTNYWVSPGSVGGVGGIANMAAEITHYRLSWSAGNFDSGNVITGAFI